MIRVLRSHGSLSLAAALSALIIGACGGDGAPTAEIVDAAPTTLDPSNDAIDDLTLRVSYTDPDGDLGGGYAEVHDCRAAGVVTRLGLPSIASQDAVDEGVEIEGTLTLVVADVGEVAPASPPAACDGKNDRFCVVLVDAEGNESEPACTGTITVAASAE